MTQATETTAERIQALIDESLDRSPSPPGVYTGVAEVIAAEIDALTAERDEAQRLIGIYSTSRDAVIAQLGEMNDALRAEVDRLTHGLALTSAVAAGKPIQYVGPLEGMKESLEASYRGALDESARQMGQMKQMMADNAQANQWLVNGVAKIERLEKERDEARERGYTLERESQSRAMIDASTIAILRAEVDGCEAGMRFQFDRAEDYKAERDEARAEVERLRPAADLGDAYLASINEDADDNDIADLQDALEAAAARARAREARK